MPLRLPDKRQKHEVGLGIAGILAARLVRPDRHFISGRHVRPRRHWEVFDG